MRALYHGETVEVLDARRREIKLWSVKYGRQITVTEVLIGLPDGSETYVDWYCLKAQRDSLQRALIDVIDTMASVPDCVREFVNTLEFD